MLNPNIEMLENLISAAVSTRYKEVPPTEEEFLTLAQSMRATLSTLPVTDEEFAEILVRLRASIVIQMDVGVYINDRNTPHYYCSCRNDGKSAPADSVSLGCRVLWPEE